MKVLSLMWTLVCFGSGDADTYKALSKGAAFDFARSRALAAGQGSRMDWRVNQYYSEPRIVHARSWVVDEGGQVAVGQVIVRFDTEQVGELYTVMEPNDS